MTEPIFDFSAKLEAEFDAEDDTPVEDTPERTHTIRHREGGTVAVRRYTRGRAILAFCTECMGWESHPKNCTAPLCPLYPFRGRMLAAISQEVPPGGLGDGPESSNAPSDHRERQQTP